MSLALEQLNQVLKGRVKKNVLIGDYVDLKIGGPAEYLFVPENAKELEQAKKIATMLGITYTVLSPHKNSLISMNGIKGLVLIVDDKPGEVENMGKLFKDVKIDDELAKDLLNKGFKQDKLKVGTILSAAWLIAEADLNRKQVGGAVLNSENLNKLENAGNATAEDVVILISLIKQQVRDKLGVQLMEEIEIIGE